MRELRCPNCGSKLITRSPTAKETVERMARNSMWGGITCDSCPAVVHISYTEGGVYFASAVLAFMTLVIPSIIIVGYTGNVSAVPIILLLALVGVSALMARGIDKGKAEIVRMRPSCKHCAAVMENEETSFCPKCGESMGNAARGGPQETQRMEIPASQRLGQCMICNFSIEADDLLAWCPHCGSPAHKAHLLEWVHVKSKCPKCGQHIDEREINLRTPEKGAGREKPKKIWKTV